MIMITLCIDVALRRHIINVEQSRERFLFGICLRVSQLLNTCSVPKDAVFLQENDNSFPLEKTDKYLSYDVFLRLPGSI